MKKSKPVGQQCLDAVEKFEKKYHKNPDLIKEVRSLQDLLASWYVTVLLNGRMRIRRD